MASIDRSEALARLAALGVTNDITDVTPSTTLELTGDEVYAGGDEVRVLVQKAHLTYREEKGGELLYADAKVGDTVLLDKVQAKRLDELGATVSKTQARKAAKAPTPVEVPAVPEGSDSDTQPDGNPPAAASSGKTDEELRAMSAADLVAHVNQHNDDKVRVRSLEGQRPSPRPTVMKATAPDGDDPDEELD